MKDNVAVVRSHASYVTSKNQPVDYYWEVSTSDFGMRSLVSYATPEIAISQARLFLRRFPEYEIFVVEEE
jgi:hypothetical protein